jgi:hypothetical protein
VPTSREQKTDRTIVRRLRTKNPQIFVWVKTISLDKNPSSAPGFKPPEELVHHLILGSGPECPFTPEVPLPPKMFFIGHCVINLLVILLNPRRIFFYTLFSEPSDIQKWGFGIKIIKKQKLFTFFLT